MTRSRKVLVAASHSPYCLALLAAEVGSVPVPVLHLTDEEIDKAVRKPSY